MNIYLLRHVEYKAGSFSENDPELSEEGKKCACDLIDDLENCDVDICYTSSLLRTKETISPFVNKNKIKTEINDLTDEGMFSFSEIGKNAKSFLDYIKKNSYKNILVCGHENFLMALEKNITDKSMARPYTLGELRKFEL